MEYAIKSKRVDKIACWYNPNNSPFWGERPKTWKTRKGVERAFDKYKQWWMNSKPLPSCATDEKTFHERFEIVEV